jgi:hypothetical protein
MPLPVLLGAASQAYVRPSTHGWVVRNSSAQHGGRNHTPLSQHFRLYVYNNGRRALRVLRRNQADLVVDINCGSAASTVSSLMNGGHLCARSFLPT